MRPAPFKISTTDMTVSGTPLEGLMLIEPQIYGDERGFFLETYNRRRYAELGIPEEFVQDNCSQSKKGVIRGLHFQDMSAPMVKLVRCSVGEVLDVAVDLRVGSPTFAHWHAVPLSAANRRQLYIPIGFGHAFLALSEPAEVEYKCSGYYNQAAEAVIAWNDPEIGIVWPEPHPVLSVRDAQGMSLRDYMRRPAFVFDGARA